MKAAEARQLKVGDFVNATFSGRGVVKACEIIAIDWPTFTLRTTNYKGDEMIRTRRYVNVSCITERSVPSSPSWLTWPEDSAR